MGIGTGAICLALLHECPGATGLGSDISRDAIQTARRNAERHGLADRLRPWKATGSSKFPVVLDIIVSNPPYIRSDVIGTLDRDVRDFDPMAALDGGEDGLAPYRDIAENAADFLGDDGLVGLKSDMIRS